MLFLREEKVNDKENIIGSNIRRLRKEKGIGQTELVKQMQLKDIEISRETLVKIEGGHQHIKLDQLRSIKSLLQVNYDELLDSHSKGDRT